MKREAGRALAAALWGLTLVGCAGAVAGREPAAISEVALQGLPAQAQQTLQLIKRGGPYPYRRDGAVFGNYEQLLPLRGRGYYREYTVPTPGASDRAARRIVAGKAGDYYYTGDHYRSFRRIRE